MRGMHEEGAADVLEEIPSILIVIVATFLFLMTMTGSIISHSRFQEEKLLADDMESFCDSFLSFEPLLLDSVYGQLDSTKLNEDMRILFQEQYDPQVLGFHYNITLLDVSLYETMYTWYAGEEPDDSSTLRLSSVPAIICNELGQHHSIILRITIWK
ncbi:MAG: hypothetical protein KAW09_12335 [Thermoplasmata archaeon]|nr:hypothetical protein [Thermoplasmata archaeon]